MASKNGLSPNQVKVKVEIEEKELRRRLLAEGYAYELSANVNEVAGATITQTQMDDDDAEEMTASFVFYAQQKANLEGVSKEAVSKPVIVVPTESEKLEQAQEQEVNLTQTR